MAWTETTRARYERHSGRYASDLTDQEWGLIAPFLPPPKTTGRPRSTAMRDVLDAILYIASAGCAWRMLPNDFPPVSTVRYYFHGWRNDGIFEVISHFLVATAREFHGKKPGPTAGVIDSQTIKTTESGGISGYDAGKKTKGRKRHIVTDTLGFMVGLVVHSAGIQDRDGAPEVLKSIRYSHPNLRHIFEDGGYAGPKLRDALEGIGDWTIQIVKRFDTAEGFEVIPRRWVVERTFAWLNRCRRLAKDWKNPSQVHRHGYSLHISEPSRVKLQGIVIMRRVLNQTLRPAPRLARKGSFILAGNPIVPRLARLRFIRALTVRYSQLYGPCSVSSTV